MEQEDLKESTAENPVKNINFEDEISSFNHSLTQDSLKSSVRQSSRKGPNTQEHPNFGRGRHRVNANAVNHELRRKLWDG